MKNTEEIKKIFYKYSVTDIITAIFVSSIWLPNISSPIKHKYLLYILLSNTEDKYKDNKKIRTYCDFTKFLNKIFPLLPSFEFYEDYIPETDWGEIKYPIGENNYKILYGGEIESSFDFLKQFQMIHFPLIDNYSRHLNKSPIEDFNNTIKLLDEIIDNIKNKTINSESEIADSGYLEIPPESFWKEVTSFLENFNYKKYSSSFLDEYSTELGCIKSDMLEQDIFNNHLYEERTFYKYFLRYRNKYYPLLIREYLGILIDKWGKIYKEKFNDLEVDIDQHIRLMSSEFADYASKRFDKDNTFTFVSAFNDSKKEVDRDLVYPFAFVSRDKLILFSILPPFISNETLDKYIKENKDYYRNSLNLFSQEKLYLALHTETSIIEFRNNIETKKLIPKIYALLPQIQTHPHMIKISESFTAKIVIFNDVLGIIDDIEEKDEFSDFIEFFESEDYQFKSILNSLSDKFASFKDSYGLLFPKTVSITSIYLDPHNGSNYRYKSLKEFWEFYPPVNFLDDPRAWKVIKEGKDKIRLSSKYFRMAVLYCKVGKVDIFINAPFHDIEIDDAMIVDFLIQIIQDCLINYQDIILQHIYFQYKNWLQIYVCPYSLVLSNENYKHLVRFSPENNPWICNWGHPVSGKDGVSVIYNTDVVIDKFDITKDRTAEIDLICDIISKVNDLTPDTDIQKILNELLRKINLPARFKLKRAEKFASFPKYSKAIVPEIRDFKSAKYYIAELCKNNGILPGKYELKEAKEFVNKIRDVLVEKINKTVSEYDIENSISYLISNIDSLTNEFKHKIFSLKQSIDQDVEFNREKEYTETHKKYIKNHKNYRYLVEKFVQLRPNGNKQLRERELKMLLGLVDWLLVIYSHSDILHYSIAPAGILIKDDYQMDNLFYQDIEKMEDEFGFEHASIVFGSAGDQNDRVDTIKPVEEFMNDFDAAFKMDIGFSLRHLVLVLEILSFWADYGKTEEKKYYIANIDDIFNVCKGHIADLERDEIIYMIDFLTLKSEELLKIIDDKEPSEDIPVWERYKRPYRYTIKPLIRLNDKFIWGPYSARNAMKVWMESPTNLQFPYNMKGHNIEGLLRLEREQMNKALNEKTDVIVKRHTTFSLKNCFLHKIDKDCGYPDNLGDYDVISFLNNKNIILNIECKDHLPDYSYKDSKRTRERVFGKVDGDHGEFRQILNREKYLNENLPKILNSLRWTFDEKNLPKVISIFVCRLKLWWYKYPPYPLNFNFLRIDTLSEFIDHL